MGFWYFNGGGFCKKNFTGSESEAFTVDNVIDNTKSDALSGVLGETFGIAGEAIAAGSKGGKKLAKGFTKAERSATKNSGSTRLKNKAADAQSALDSHKKVGEVSGSTLGSNSTDMVSAMSSSSTNNTNATQRTSTAQPDNTRVIIRRN